MKIVQLPPISAQGLRRLSILATFLEGLQIGEENFDLDNWGYDGKRCGTVACAVGWGTSCPELNAEGFTHDGKSRSPVLAYEGDKAHTVGEWTAVRAFFDLCGEAEFRNVQTSGTQKKFYPVIEEEISHLLFDSFFYRKGVTRQEVVDRIRAVVEFASKNLDGVMKITKVDPLSTTTVRRLMFLKDWLATLPDNAVRFDFGWGKMVDGLPMGAPAGLATQCPMLQKEGLYSVRPPQFTPAYRGQREYVSNCWAAIELFFDLSKEVCRVEFERDGMSNHGYNVPVLDAIFKGENYPKALVNGRYSPEKVFTYVVVQRISDILSLNAQFNQ